jgi:MYXO-CTERM domain-containing protein
VLANPLFAGPLTVPPATNLELTMSSPAIGTGVQLAAVTHDFLGAPRPAVGTDLGAFQYGAIAPGDGGVGPLGEAGAVSGDDAGETAGRDASGEAEDGAAGQPADGGVIGAHGASSSGCTCSQAGHAGNGSKLTIGSVALAALVGLTALRRRANKRTGRSQNRWSTHDSVRPASRSRASALDA